MKTTLCICISTYNRSSKIALLVRKILENKSDQISVVVVDDHSSDDTLFQLEKIQDSRLSVYSNEKNLGATANWFETMDKGNGDYTLHILDRDWLEVKYIQPLISILENENPGFAYFKNIISFGKRKKQENGVERYKCGEEAEYIFAFTLIHPSGTIIKKDVWDAIESKKKFFLGDKYGIYPHSYLLALAAQISDGIIIPYRMIYSDTDLIVKYHSRFYTKTRNNLEYWWTPEARFLELMKITDYIFHNDEEFHPLNSIKLEILRNRYKELLNSATICYAGNESNVKNTMHYNVNRRIVSTEEILKINTRFSLRYIYEIIKNYWRYITISFLISLVKETKENKKAIVLKRKNAYIREAKLSNLLLLTETWIKAKQEGKEINQFFIDHEIHTVAIYGNGKYGKLIMNELKNSSIKVSYLIDQKANEMIEDIPVISLQNELPSVDAILVCVLDSFEQIQERLIKKTDAKILSLEHLIYYM